MIINLTYIQFTRHTPVVLSGASSTNTSRETKLNIVWNMMLTIVLSLAPTVNCFDTLYRRLDT